MIAASLIVVLVTVGPGKELNFGLSSALAIYNTIIRTTVDKKNGGLALLAYTLPTYRNNSTISTRETKYLITISE